MSGSSNLDVRTVPTGWSGLLGKRNLQAASRRVRDMCTQCSISPESPCVRSACVVSMEMNPSFQVMADTFKQEEKQSSNCPLQTPRDASVTHILVFPTSATAQVAYFAGFYGLSGVQVVSFVSW